MDELKIPSVEIESSLNPYRYLSDDNIADIRKTLLVAYKELVSSCKLLESSLGGILELVDFAYSERRKYTLRVGVYEVRTKTKKAYLMYHIVSDNRYYFQDWCYGSWFKVDELELYIDHPCTYNLWVRDINSFVERKC